MATFDSAESIKSNDVYIAFETFDDSPQGGIPVGYAIPIQGDSKVYVALPYDMEGDIRHAALFSGNDEAEARSKAFDYLCKQWCDYKRSEVAE